MNGQPSTHIIMPETREAPGPIHLASAHEGVIPHRYIVWKHSQHCVCCGSRHEWSELYAETHLRSTLGAGHYITNYRPLTTPEFDLPIEVRVAREKQIPFCHRCHYPTLHDLPAPPATDPHRILSGCQEKPIKTPEHKKPIKPTPGVETLMDLFK